MFQKSDHGLNCQSGLLGNLQRSISLEVFTVPSASSKGIEVKGHVPWISVWFFKEEKRFINLEN